MMKRVVSVIMLLGIVFTLSSCGGIEYRFRLADDIHEAIEYHAEADPPHFSAYIIYKDVKYLYAGGSSFLQVENKTDDIMLSWNGSRWVGYIDEYYSYTDDAPTYIYEARNHLVYFREDYNYHSDLFVIENSEDEIAFSDICSAEQEAFVFYHPKKIELRSKTNPRIKVVAEIVSVDDSWYVSFEGTSGVWTPSDMFWNLIKNDLNQQS